MTQPIVNIAYNNNWNPYDSYGRLAHELRHHFLSQDYHVNAFGADVPEGNIKLALGGIHLGYPTNMQNHPPFTLQGPQIAITAWETTKPLPNWVENLNKMDAVSVWCEHNKLMLEDAGVTAPIIVCPLGISQAFTSGEIQKRTFAKDDTLRILAIGDRGERKAWDKAVASFKQAFGDDERYQLIVKARRLNIPITERLRVVGPSMTHAEKTELLAQDGNALIIRVPHVQVNRTVQGVNLHFADAEFSGAEILALAQDDRYQITILAESVININGNITAIGADYTETQMRQLYETCQVMLFPAKGEGFGFPPREFASTGGIAIATAWSGTADEIECWGVPLRVTEDDMIPAWQDREHEPKWIGLDLGHWANVQEERIVRTLHDIANNFDAYAERAVQSAHWVRQNYTWHRYGEHIRHLWEGALHGTLDHANHKLA